jgi:cysteinyl-tRNA synthetase
MEIKVYNSLTNQKEIFKPIIPGEVSCYVCGPTVYNYVHIGNMRPVVTFDLLRRLFIRLGYKVNFVSNFTDLDDKIINQAIKEGVSEKELAEKYIAAFEENRETIHALKPTFQPRVTETMPEIISFIDNLVKTGYAYEADGDVFFRVSKISDYGCLSGMKPDDLIAGARIEENTKKESPLDFALWKKTDVGIQYQTPWSMGRPGWHTECVVMINKIFGHKIDIHGGGFDLKFPHHENEIAQEEATNKHKIANYWMHNGFINIDNEKMSKSLGNVKLAKDLLKGYGGNAVRFVLVNSYYRSPVNFSDELLVSADKEIKKIEQTYRKLAVKLQTLGFDINENYEGKLNSDKFLEAMADDLNTPNALTELYAELKLGNVALRKPDVTIDELKGIFFTLKDELWVLGFEYDLPILSDDDIKLLNDYEAARKAKDFATADILRAKLIEKELL